MKPGEPPNEPKTKKTVKSDDQSCRLGSHRSADIRRHLPRFPAAGEPREAGPADGLDGHAEGGGRGDEEQEEAVVASLFFFFFFFPPFLEKKKSELSFLVFSSSFPLPELKKKKKNRNKKTHPDALSHPRAVVVKPQDAIIAERTVGGPRRAVVGAGPAPFTDNDRTRLRDRHLELLRFLEGRRGDVVSGLVSVAVLDPACFGGGEQVRRARVPRQEARI